MKLTCATCKPADMPCQISKECKRERRTLKRLDESFRWETLYKKITGKCLHKINITKIKVNKNGLIANQFISKKEEN